MVKMKYVAHSANKKTGDISQTYSEPKTCPVSCPFKGHGCYGENFTTRKHWVQSNCTSKTIGDAMESKGHTKVLRHNVAGDMCIYGTGELDGELIRDLSRAYKGIKAYTYTHADKTYMNFYLIHKAAEQGFVINMSCETLGQVIECRENHVPAVLAVYEWTAKDKVTRRINGITYRLCPASYDKNMTCRDCGKCWKKGRKEVVVFPAHGTGKKKTWDFLMDF